MIHGFDQEMVETRRHVQIVVARNGDDQGTGRYRILPQFRRDLLAGHVRKCQVEQHNIRQKSAGGLEGLASVESGPRLITLQLEENLDHLGCIDAVVDDQHPLSLSASVLWDHGWYL